MNGSGSCIAVQYNGQPVHRFLSPFRKEEQPHLIFSRRNILWLIKDDEQIQIAKTDWLVLEKGDYSVYTHENFKHNFDKVLWKKDAST